MVSWLKSLSAAALALLAVLAATVAGRHKRRARALQARVGELSGAERDRALASVKASQDRAEALRNKSLETLDLVGEQNEDLQDVLDSWRSSRLRD